MNCPNCNHQTSVRSGRRYLDNIYRQIRQCDHCDCRFECIDNKITRIVIQPGRREVKLILSEIWDAVGDVRFAVKHGNEQDQREMFRQWVKLTRELKQQGIERYKRPE